MTPWIAAILIGLGSMKIVELIKEALPWPLQAWTKSALSLGITIALSAGLSDGLMSKILIALGASGIAALSHEARDFLSANGDVAKTTVMTRASGSRRRLPL